MGKEVPMRLWPILAISTAIAHVACDPGESPPPPCLRAPSGLFVTLGPIGPDLLPGGLTVSWTDHATCEAGYEIERAMPLGAFEPLAQAPPDSTTYADSSLVAPAPGAYCYGCAYRVRAMSGGSPPSAWSNEAIAPSSPPPPPPMP